MKDKNYCLRIEGMCPHKISKTKKTCFIIIPYEELHSKNIEKMLKSAVTSVFKLTPVIGKNLKRLGSSDMYCTRVCRPIKEATQCIADLTYKNTNVGFEIAVAQSFEKPVIITRYITQNKGLTDEEKELIDKLKQKGEIQCSEVPNDVPADINGIFRVDYKNETELKRKLKEAFYPR